MGQAYPFTASSSGGKIITTPLRVDMVMNKAPFSFVGQLIIAADTALRTLTGNPKITERSQPDKSIKEASLSETEKRHVTGLMRINHCGEVCAQALYQGQALTAQLPEVREKMELAAMEENDHLHWCRNRVSQLGGSTSILDPLFYAGSFAIGALAGIAGDKWSLGFVAETEKQVVKHLDSHLNSIPKQDEKTRAILEVMKEDELRHATTALKAGGAELPDVIKKGMGFVSKLMTETTYRF